MYPILLTMGACGVLSACSIREDAFVVADAELVDPAYLTTLDRRAEADAARDRDRRYGVSAHRLRAGRGTVIGYRRFDQGDWTAVDDESFLKITLWLPHDAPHRASIPLADARQVVAVYSAGGSAWPQAGCSGYLRPGSATLTPQGADWEVRLEARLVPSGNAAYRGCEPRDVHMTFTAAPLDIATLTPWLGSASEHVYEETYR